jgi:molybdopterin converting factor small subunit
MQIFLIPKSILRMSIGKEELKLDLPKNATALIACNALAAQYGSVVQDFLFDKKTGKTHVLFVVNRKQVTKDHVLEQNDRLTILSPVAGG